jgi:hypothetical protein
MYSESDGKHHKILQVQYTVSTESGRRIEKCKERNSKYESQIANLNQFHQQ